jgi:UDPglucose 6-dehydrogenase
VQQINADQMVRFVKKIQDTLWVLKDKKIAVLGLAFEQNTDDVRSSPAIDLCKRLIKEARALRVYDPEGMDKARGLLPEDASTTYVDDMNAVADGCDAPRNCDRMAAVHRARPRTGPQNDDDPDFLRWHAISSTRSK